jgi:putative transposase
VKLVAFAEVPAMSDFKGRRSPTDIILVCVCLVLQYGISYRDLEEMMAHTTLFHWLQQCYGCRIICIA